MTQAPQTNDIGSKVPERLIVAVYSRDYFSLEDGHLAVGQLQLC